MRVINIIVILTFLTIESIACTCKERINKRKLIKSSDFAFVGVVAENVYRDEFEAMMLKDRGVQTDAKIKIIKLIKGTTSTDHVFVISSGSGECDINLLPGKKYLIIGNFKPREPNITFDPKLLPPDSLVQLDSIPIDMGTTQPKTRTRDEWLNELGQTSKVIFTTMCMTFYIKSEE
jgi:hypothetical protein